MRKFLVPVVVMTLLGGCSMVPDYHRPDVETPQAWQEAASTETKIAADWWKNFGSDELNGLMDQALTQNLDLRAALQRVEQSRAGVGVAGASLLPTADASGGVSRSYSNPGSARNSWRGGASISYEVDLFGANGAGVQAAKANLLGSRFDRDALALVVMGDVAKQYFSLLNLRERVAIAENNLKISREVLEIITARFNAGADSNLELSQQKTAVASNEASLASLRQQVDVAENALALLLGRPPQSVQVEASALTGLKVPEIVPGQPSTLLERRPDIRSAEAGLLAANANIGAARSAFFPSISLGIDVAIAGDPVSRSLGLASSILAPIFSGGRLEGNLSQSKARQAELVENYRKVVLTSFGEVEDTLGAAKAAREREAAFAEARTQAQTSYDLSLQRYKAGSIDYQSLLDTQRSLFGAQDSYASVRLEMLNAAVDLYKALGGGWASEQ